MATLLINKPTLAAKSRFADPNIDFDNKVAPIIKEVQQLHVKPQLGDVFYNKLISYVSSHTEVNTYLDKLLAGGSYEHCDDTYEFEGLEAAIANYTHAGLMDAQAGFLAVGGFRSGSDTYSSMADYKDRRNNYDAVMAVAESYMQDCITYLRRNAKGAEFEVCRSRVRKNRFFTITS